MTDKPRITKVYRFANDMVIVFDQHGQQMRLTASAPPDSTTYGTAR